MKGKKEKAAFVFVRYFILLVLGILYPLLSLIILYLTIYPSYFLLNSIYEASVSGYILTISGVEVGIVNACVAGSAYYLLLILNLATEMNARKRIYSLIFSLTSLLAVNILRIFVFSILLIENYAYFDFLHKVFWYFMSILLVAFIWFLTAMIFKIRKIPVYSDLRFLFKSYVVYHTDRKNPNKSKKQNKRKFK